MKRKKFLRILAVELDDLSEHIDWLIGDYEERVKRREVTERVCHENVAVLNNERRAIRHFADVLSRIDPASCDTMDALAEDVKRRFQETLRCSGLARAAYLFAERKIDRVRTYVRHGAPANESAVSLLQTAKAGGEGASRG